MGGHEAIVPRFEHEQLPKRRAVAFLAAKMFVKDLSHDGDIEPLTTRRPGIQYSRFKFGAKRAPKPRVERDLEAGFRLFSDGSIETAR